MVDYKILAETRTEIGKKTKRVRAQGYVPAVLYGGNQAPTNLKFVERDLERVVQSAGTSNLITIQVGEQGINQAALLRDVQYDSIRRTIQHVDFYRVSMDEEITTEIGIVLVGHGPIDGMVVQDMNSIEAKCLPGDLVSTFEADIDKLLEIGDTLTVSDLDVPDTIVVSAGPEEVVAHVEGLREEKVEEEVLEDAFQVGDVRTVSETREDSEEFMD
ncbi:MAG: 50S ribosomal protein L25 [Anaerolineales bacterium]|nr:50S ribosomal protein L25 [Anaerolineales bacterium]